MHRKGQDSSCESTGSTLETKTRLREALRVYLRNLDLEYSVIPCGQEGKPGDDAKIEMMFTRKVLPLDPDQLAMPDRETNRRAGCRRPAGRTQPYI